MGCGLSKQSIVPDVGKQYTHFFNGPDPAKNRRILLQGFRISVQEGAVLRVKLFIEDVCVQDQVCKPGTKTVHIRFLGIDFPLYKCLNTTVRAEFFIDGKRPLLEEIIKEPSEMDIQYRAQRAKYLIGGSKEINSIEFYGEFAWLGYKAYRVEDKKSNFTEVVPNSF